MSDVARGILKTKLEAEQKNLDDLKTDHKATIDAGQRAQREVDTQARLVAEIRLAIADLEDADRKRQHEVTA